MSNSTNTKYYNIGGIRFTVNFLSPFFSFDSKGGSELFSDSQIPSRGNWTMNFNLSNKGLNNNWETIFKGSEQFQEELPYKWSVVKRGEKEGVYVEFEEGHPIVGAIAFIDNESNTIDIKIQPNGTGVCEIDPFFQPLGILLLQYIVHIYGGFVIHASTVSLNKKGYLFSAVSGTGKSTMAKIWQSKGAIIINDDRLIILPVADDYMAYNTPMPYYQDKSKSVKLHKAFLIQQSPDNYLKKLPLVKGALGLMGNCMQFQYDEKQVNSRLDALLAVADQCTVYECGFKPDEDIVDLIHNEIG